MVTIEDFILDENIDKGTGSILLVDGNNLAARSNYAEPNLTRSDGTPTGISYVSLRSLKKMIDTFSPEKIIMVFDKGISQWRLKIYPEYKQARRMENKTEEEQFERLVYINQIKRFQQYIDALPITQIRFDGMEADDVIGYIANKYISQGKQSSLVIVSTDKDFYQFIPFGVKIYNGIDNKFITKEYIEEKFGVSPENYIFFKSMIGDSGDGINGVKGFGESAARSLIEKGEKIKDVSTLKDKANSFIAEKLAQKKKCEKYQKFVENFKDIERNYKLMNLSELTNLISPERGKEIDDLLLKKEEFKVDQFKVLAEEDEIKLSQEFIDAFNRLS